MTAPTVQLLCGDVRAMLRTLPEASIAACITSPPYLGLRVYGTPPQVWGGDPACSHAWGAPEPPRRSRWGDLDSLSEKQASNRGSASNVAAMGSATGRFCQHCPAWLGELGSEPTVSLYVAHLVDVFREVRRVLRHDAVLWINIGDSYCSTPAGNKGPIVDDDGAFARRHARMRAATGEDAMRRPVDWRADRIKPKDMCLVPQRLALALQEDGWWVRCDCLWHKPNGGTESVDDRPSNKDKEYLWMLTPGPDNYWDDEAVREPATSRKAGTPTHWDTADGAHGTIHRRTRGHASGALVPHADNAQDRHGLARETVYSTRRIRSVWRIAARGFPGAHFATFPEALVEPCILASTSAHGCCGACGAPYARIVELGAPDLEHQRACGSDRNGSYNGHARKAFEEAGAERADDRKRNTLAGMKERRTVGWRPTCACHPAFAGELSRPVVLDPFVGSGTVGAAAVRHGRSFVGIDLSADYIEMARERISKAQPLETT